MSSCEAGEGVKFELELDHGTRRDRCLRSGDARRRRIAARRRGSDLLDEENAPCRVRSAAAAVRMPLKRSNKVVRY